MRCRPISMLVFVVRCLVESKKEKVHKRKKECEVLFLCKKCHKNIHKNKPVVSHTPVVNLTRERQPIFSLFFYIPMHVLPEVIDGIFSPSHSLIHFFFMGTKKEQNELCIE